MSGDSLCVPLLEKLIGCWCSVVGVLVSWFLGFKDYWCLGVLFLVCLVSKFIGVLVSKFHGFLVPKIRSFLSSKIQEFVNAFKDIGPVLPTFDFMFFDK